MTPTPRNNDDFFITAYFTASGNSLQLVQYSDLQRYELQATIPRAMELSLREMESFLMDGPVHVDMRDAASLPPPLAAYTRQLGCEAAAYVPILQKGQLRGFLLIGARAGQAIGDEIVNAFSRTIRLTLNSIDSHASPTEPLNDRRSLEIKAIDALAANIASVDELRSFYT